MLMIPHKIQSSVQHSALVASVDGVSFRELVREERRKTYVRAAITKISSLSHSFVIGSTVAASERPFLSIVLLSAELASRNSNRKNNTKTHALVASIDTSPLFCRSRPTAVARVGMHTSSVKTRVSIILRVCSQINVT